MMLSIIPLADGCRPRRYTPATYNGGNAMRTRGELVRGYFPPHRRYSPSGRISRESFSIICFCACASDAIYPEKRDQARLNMFD